MEHTDPEDQGLTIQLTFCRICAELSSEEHCIYETAYKEGTLSMHMMMERLIPSVFNAEQVKVDEFMCFPRKICGTCKGKVLVAYGLYEMSLKSGDLLRNCLKKNATFIVNITGGGSNEAPDVLVSHPRKIVQSPVGNKSQKAVVETASVPIVLKGEALMKQPNAMDGCSIDDQMHASENEDHQSCSGEESVVLSALKAKTDTAHEKRKPRKRVATRRKTRSSRTNAPQQQQAESNASPEETDEPEEKITKFRCLLCSEPAFSALSKLTDHLKMAHAQEIHCCNLCPKVFMKKEAFEHHQYCHATGRSHFCLFCDKGFQTEQLLKNHIKTHTHGTGFLCSHCGQEFSNRSNLRQHLIRHTGDKPWQCSLCPSRFSMKSYLDRHQHTHTKAKFFSCDTCGSQFSRHYSLVKHQLIHTGDRHFTCEVCNMRFTSSHHVKRHMLTHTGEKPFKCTYCERSFTQSNDMVKHMKTHVGSNPYQCDRCDASFRLLTDLRNHYKEHYQAGSSKDALSGEEDKTIRFTSTNIMKIRYEKEMNQHNDKSMESRM